jgi:hypothetical protein
MPIDNLTLLRHQPPPVQPRHRPWWVAPLVFLLGAAILLTAATLSLGDNTHMRLVAVICFALAAVFSLWRLSIGRQQGGLLGALYRSKHAVGTILAGDEERDGLAISLWLLSGLALILAVSLWTKAGGTLGKRPSAAPPGVAVPGGKP